MVDDKYPAPPNFYLRRLLTDLHEVESERDALKAAIEQARKRIRDTMDAFRGCPDHAVEQERCVMCQGRGQTIDRMVAALTASAPDAVPGR